MPLNLSPGVTAAAMGPPASMRSRHREE